jgi:hypothetical protein
MTDDEAIAESRRVQARIVKLEEVQGRFLDTVVAAAIRSGDAGVMAGLAVKLPGNVHRIELERCLDEVRRGRPGPATWVRGRADDDTVRKMTDEQRAVAARRAEGQIRKLHERLDLLLGPMAKAAVASGDAARIGDLADRLPEGFYRTELRVWRNRLAGDLVDGGQAEDAAVPGA